MLAKISEYKHSLRADGLGKRSLQLDVGNLLVEASPSPGETRTTGFRGGFIGQVVNPEELVEEANLAQELGD